MPVSNKTLPAPTCHYVKGCTWPIALPVVVELG